MEKFKSDGHLVKTTFFLFSLRRRHEKPKISKTTCRTFPVGLQPEFLIQDEGIKRAMEMDENEIVKMMRKRANIKSKQL